MQKKFSVKKAKAMSLKDAKKYLTKFFVPLESGDHAVLKNGKFEIINETKLKSAFFGRLPSELKKFYFNEFCEVREVTYKLNEPTFIGDDELNLCPKFKHKYQAYKKFSKEAKKGVQVILDYMKEVLCADREDMYDYLVAWIANMMQGNKNQACPYLRGPQGCGKSTITTFLIKHVIGEELALETGSEPIKSKFNCILAGKVFVVLEELENFSVSEWQVVSTRLKRSITSDIITIEKKGIDSYNAPNLNNYIINTNNDAVKDDDGRRYVIFDVQTHRTKDTAYWEKIHEQFTDEIGHAFFCYMLEVDTEDFNSQVYPETRNKKDSIAKRLDNAYVFLKEKYIFMDSHLKLSVKSLYKDYEEFCKKKEQRALCKIDFNKKLRDVGIDYRKTSGFLIFDVKLERLLEIANKHKWIHELDEYKMEQEKKLDKSMFNKHYEEEEEEDDGRYDTFMFKVKKPEPTNNDIKQMKGIMESLQQLKQIREAREGSIFDTFMFKVKKPKVHEKYYHIDVEEEDDERLDKPIFGVSMSGFKAMTSCLINFTNF
jgi:hypothetical protein